MNKLVGARTLILLCIATLCGTALDVVMILKTDAGTLAGFMGVLGLLGAYIGAKKADTTVMNGNGGTENGSK